jgi:hypothetical protein
LYFRSIFTALLEYLSVFSEAPMTNVGLFIINYLKKSSSG